MKTLKILFILLLAGGSIFPVGAQTSGKLNFSCGTYAPSGTWGTKHVAAIWIQNNANPSVFIKTQAKYGNEDDHLTSWIAASGKSLVDAVTGATLNTYGTLSVEWNGTDVSGTVVPDGDYTIYIEMGWGRDKVAQHNTTSYSFNKSGNTQQLSPNDDTHYSSININWQPTATLVATLEDKDGIGVFPNPTTGAVAIDFQAEMQRVELAVSDLAGKRFYTEHLDQIPAGLKKTLNLSHLPSGMYLLTVANDAERFQYKLILNR